VSQHAQLAGIEDWRSDLLLRSATVPWQRRDEREHQWGLLRQYFPKGPRTGSMHSVDALGRRGGKR